MRRTTKRLILSPPTTVLLLTLAYPERAGEHKRLITENLTIVPERARTSNLWLRRPTLCPIELRGLKPQIVMTPTLYQGGSVMQASVTPQRSRVEALETC